MNQQHNAAPHSSLSSPDTKLTFHLIDHAAALRLQVAPQLSVKRKAALGQFMTPLPIARFMASLFPPTILQTCRLLDAGAGIGVLSCAFLDCWACADGFAFKSVEVDAYEIDDTFR
jgi:adenine-specific DNA-methyltransferase